MKTLLILLLSAMTIFAQDIFLPEHDTTKQLLVYPGFTLQYNEEHEQADWVAYRLDLIELTPVVKRKDRFKSDKNVITGSASLKDYKGSGYDRGHLAPAADMRFSEETMLQSFYMSNMSPQLPGFNRGIWKELEALVRDFARDCEELHVVTGPVLSGGLKTIGENKVSVPDYYFKALLDIKEPEIKMIAFLLPNEKSSEDLTSFVVCVDSLENLTGIDMFYQLADSLEIILEAEINPDLWLGEPIKDSK
ncbi:MAG: endonuclease [Melioribacteraceae bacterium]|nr:MAG: endonuclease [Melioribacteraceae bacterium]